MLKNPRPATEVLTNRYLIFQCFKSTNDLLDAFQIQPDTVNGSLSLADIQRLLPALVNVKFNDGCSKSQGRATWKSIY